MPNFILESSDWVRVKEVGHIDLIKFDWPYRFMTIKNDVFTSNRPASINIYVLHVYSCLKKGKFNYMKYKN